MTGWGSWPNGRSRLRKARHHCCLTTWSRWSWLSISPSWSSNLSEGYPYVSWHLVFSMPVQVLGKYYGILLGWLCWYPDSFQWNKISQKYLVECHQGCSLQSFNCWLGSLEFTTTVAPSSFYFVFLFKNLQNFFISLHCRPLCVLVRKRMLAC